MYDVIKDPYKVVRPKTTYYVCFGTDYVSCRNTDIS